VARTWESFGVLVGFERAVAARAAVAELREASRRTWAAQERNGVDVAAIEVMDRQSLELVREDGSEQRLDVHLGAKPDAALLIVAEVPLGTGASGTLDQLAVLRDPSADGPLVRLVRTLERHGASLDDAALALPGDERRLADLLAFREAVPSAVNARIGRLRREVEPRLVKVGGDVIVPFDRMPELVTCLDELAEARGLDLATWGHASDGNLHPNVLPSSWRDVVEGRAFQLDLGRRVLAMGGCPMAEHGVGRHPVKQQLLREMYGEAGIEQMKAVRTALDPRGVLAPGVLWS
jgi:FAD/FMN-containing dehydrogenase